MLITKVYNFSKVKTAYLKNLKKHNLREIYIISYIIWKNNRFKQISIEKLK